MRGCVRVSCARPCAILKVMSWLKKLEPRRLMRHAGLNWGNLVTKNVRRFFNPGVSSAQSYQTVNGAYGVANDYKLNTRYRSLAELTGSK